MGENEETFEDKTLDMSDEDFLAMDPSEFDNIGSNDSGNESNNDEDDNEEVDDSSNEDDSEDLDDSDDNETDGDTHEDDDETDDEDEDDDSSEGRIEDDDDEEESDTDGDDQETDDSNDDQVDFEAGYKRIMEPFKANGKEMKVDNIDDAIQLMQMGAGFSKRMGQLKPHLKIIKTLESHDLLDPDKINNLIDISKKDPKAIAKLVKDSDIDPLDIDTSNVDYKPNNYEMSDQDYDLNQAIDEIRDTESFEKSMDIMGKQWDAKSRQLIGENPEVVSIINSHVESGIFDTVQGVVEREKALGRLNGVSDVEAYRQVAYALQEQGVLKNDNRPEGGDDNKDALQEEAKKKKAAKTKKRKKAAAPTKRKGSKTKETPAYLDMPDDEFLKKFG